MHESNKQSSSTTDQQQRSANYKNYDHNRPAWRQASVEDKRLWTSMQSTKEKESTTVTKEKAKEKERIKAKATEDTTATDTTVTTSTTKEKESMEEKDSIATTTVRSASAIHSEEPTKETKDSAKDTTEAKERTKENKRQIHATDVEEQDILPKTAEWQYTTLDKEKAMTLKIRQHNGTTTTTTMDGTSANPIHRQPRYDTNPCHRHDQRWQ